MQTFINNPTRSIVFLVWMLLLAGQAYPTNYYFSNSAGDDSRSSTDAQSPSTPWKSIDKLNAIQSSLSAGDIIYFMAGDTFVGEIQTGASGTSGSPITYTSYGGGKAIISGFTRVTGWTSVGGGIFESDAMGFSYKPNMVVIEGKNYAMGRYPNADAANSGYLTIQWTGSNAVDGGFSSSITDFTGSEMVLRNAHWILDRVEVTSHSGGVVEFNPVTGYDPDEGYGFFFQDHIETLDQYGEWFYDTGNEKLYVYFGSAGPAAEVWVSKENVLVDANDDHIVFENIDFVGANERVFFSDGVTYDLQIKNCRIQYTGQDGVFCTGRHDLLIEDCEILNTNNNAIDLAWDNPGYTISNNFIKNTGMQAGMGLSSDLKYVAIFTRGGGTIEYNQVINTGYNAIHFHDLENVVQYNYVDSFCIIKDDGAGIYTYDASQNGTLPHNIVQDNIVLNGLGQPEGTPSKRGSAEGIYLDDNCSHIDVLRNTVAHCANNGLFIHNTRDFIIKDNLFYDNGVGFYTKEDYLGSTLITGGDVQDNFFICKNSSQLASLMISEKGANIGNIASFNHNRYCRPIGGGLIIQEQFYDPSSDYQYNRAYSVDEWKLVYSTDATSTSCPLTFPAYTILTAYSNAVPNGTFSSGISGVGCWGPYGCGTSHNTSELDAGCVEVDAHGYAHNSIGIGSVDNTKSYIARFSSITNSSTKGTVQVGMMQSTSPWSTLIRDQAVRVDNNRTEHEVLLQGPISDPDVSLIFRMGDGDFKWYYDNVEFFEADIQLTDPDDYLLFETNYSSSPKTIYFSGVYVDADSNSYTGSYTIPPYSGIVLIFASAGVPGCTDASAHNYNPAATIDNGSCQTCTDGILNGDEVDVDCGGVLCSPCVPVSIGNEADDTYAFYPNPINDQLYIKMKEAGFIKIRDVQGKTVYNSYLLTSSVRLDVSHLDKGVYILEMGGENHKLIKN